MRPLFWKSRSLTVAFTLVAVSAFAQQSGSQQPSSPGGGGPSGGSTPGVGTPGSPGTRQPNFPNDRQQQQFPEMRRPIMLSGKVVMEDGTPPPDSVIIEKVCNGQPQPQGYTNSKGHFSITLGQNQFMVADASTSNVGTGGMETGGIGAIGGGSRSGPFGPGNGVSERELMGCELRASLPGYRSEVVNLSGRRFMDNPDLGTIVLRRLANVQGLTFSATSAAAPKNARKAYDKGREHARKQKWEAAQKELEKAVSIYPEYANAWSDLGLVHEAQQHQAEAREAYAKAIAADDKLVKPYLQLAWMDARENKWAEAAEQSDKALRLNPMDFPSAYFVNAVAHLNLQHLDEAERSAREGLKLDSRNSIPKMRHILGVVLAQKRDFTGAAENMKGYLSLLPAEGQETELIKKQLAEVERLMSAQNR